MKKRHFVFALRTLRLALAFAACMVKLPLLAADAPVRVLIFSGQNNHDWKETTPKLEGILKADGRFRVTITNHPEQCSADTLAPYDAVLSNWNTFGNPPVTNWPASTRKAFSDFVRGGKGFVVVHAGASSFYDWPEYQQIGGAWWAMEQTSHGAPQEFTVKFTADHPITRSLQPFTTKDELWIRPGVHPEATVIATGNDQPIAMVTRLGKGRGFTLLLGHNASFMENPGFKTLLIRGTAWAAAGRVSEP
jgi:type 1 glutamine amidotransferase